MVRVLLTPEAQDDVHTLPASMKPRVLTVIERLAMFPNVSGIKWLRGPLAGQGRIRCGDWRVLFRPVAPDVIVVRVRHRSEVYED
jgi:mRNA-degrading endonuclease RelE of RelBE toxin-antitoxin system